MTIRNDNLEPVGEAEIEFFNDLKSFIDADLTEKEASLTDEIDRRQNPDSQENLPPKLASMDLRTIIQNEHCYKGFVETLEKNAELIDDIVLSLLIGEDE